MTNTTQFLLPRLTALVAVIGLFLYTPHIVYAQVYTDDGCGATEVQSLNSWDCSPNYMTCTPDLMGQSRAQKLRECPAGSGNFYLADQPGRCVANATCAGTAPSVSINANPTSIVRGNSSVVSWTSLNTTSCTSTTLSTGGATSGLVSVSPSVTTSYDVTCTGPAGSTGIKSVTVTVTAPVFGASCSVNPTLATTGQSVTWSALAWNGVAPYSFSWIGQIIQGLTGPNVPAVYTTTGTKIGQVQVADSTVNASGVSLTNNDDKICTGPILASNITPGLQEDGGYPAGAQKEAYSFTRGGFLGGIGPFYNQAYAATYAAVKANPQNYCIDVKLSQACNPPNNWGGCNWSFWINIHQGTGLRDPLASDQGPYVPDTIGQWNQARFFGAVLGTPSTGSQTITNVCLNSVAVTAAVTTATLSANPISVVQGGSSTLTWTSTNATSCTSPDFNTGGATSNNVGVSVSPAVDTTYTINCTGTGAPASSSVTVSVVAASCVWRYVDASDTVDLWGNVYQRCLFQNVSALPQCAAGLSQASDGMTAPPGPPGGCKLSPCEKLKKVGAGCALTAAADLKAGNVTTSAAPVAGTPVTLQSMALNSGTASSGGFPVLFQIQSPADYRVSSYLAPLSSDSSAPATASYTFPSAATYQVRACANYADTTFSSPITPESDSSNNCSGWTSITVTGSAQPDLTAVLNVPPVATVGTPVILSGVVSNSVSAATGAGFIDLFQRATDSSGTGATDIGTYANAALAGGASNPATLSYTFPSAGTWYIRICADKSSAGNLGVIAESDENNNCAGAGGANWTAITVNPSAGPATITSCIPSPGAGPTGSPVTWTVTTSGFSPAPTSITWSAPAGTPSSQSGLANTFASSFASAGNYSPSVTVTNGAQSAGPTSCTPVTIGSVCAGSPTGTLTATPNRIRASTPTPVTFSLPSIQNVTTSCTLTGPGMATSPAPFTPNSCTVSGSFTTTITIPTQSTYTLTCDGVKTATVNVNVLPKFQEF